MSKGLKALDRVIRNPIFYDTKDTDIIEKELKALEIIKKKRVIMTWIFDCKSIHEYNSLVIGKYILNEEEYNLLKEVL